MGDSWGRIVESGEIGLERFGGLGTHFEQVWGTWCQIVETVAVGLERLGGFGKGFGDGVGRLGWGGCRSWKRTKSHTPRPHPLSRIL